MPENDAEQAVPLAEAQHDKETLARSLIYLGYLLPVQDEYKTAKRTLEISEEIQHQQLIAKRLNALGISHYNQQESHKVLQHFQRSQEIFESLGDLRGVSMVVYTMRS